MRDLIVSRFPIVKNALRSPFSHAGARSWRRFYSRDRRLRSPVDRRGHCRRCSARPSAGCSSRRGREAAGSGRNRDRPRSADGRRDLRASQRTALKIDRDTREKNVRKLRTYIHIFSGEEVTTRRRKSANSLNTVEQALPRNVRRKESWRACPRRGRVHSISRRGSISSPLISDGDARALFVSPLCTRAGWTSWRTTTTTTGSGKVGLPSLASRVTLRSRLTRGTGRRSRGELYGNAFWPLNSWQGVARLGPLDGKDDVLMAAGRRPRANRM